MHFGPGCPTSPRGRRVRLPSRPCESARCPSCPMLPSPAFHTDAISLNLPDVPICMPSESAISLPGRTNVYSNSSACRIDYVSPQLSAEAGLPRNCSGGSRGRDWGSCPGHQERRTPKRGENKVNWKLSSDGPSPRGGHSLEILPRAPETIHPLLVYVERFPRLRSPSCCGSIGVARGAVGACAPPDPYYPFKFYY